MLGRGLGRGLGLSLGLSLGRALCCAAPVVTDCEGPPFVLLDVATTDDPCAAQRGKADFGIAPGA